MPQKIDINKDMSKEEKQIIRNIQKDKNKAFILMWLLLILMLLESALDFLLNINTFILLVITYCFSILIFSYVIYKLQSTQRLLSIVFTANHNKVDVQKLFKLSKKQLENIEFIKLSWRTFILEYIVIFCGSFLCTNILFISYINHFVN